MYDCKTCTRPQPAACTTCPLANGLQPKIDEWLALDLQLHSDMKRWGTLPDAGGLLDQDPAVMRRINFIEDVYQECERKRIEREEKKREREARRARMSTRR